jgi:hypothetical protein
LPQQQPAAAARSATNAGAATQLTSTTGLVQTANGANWNTTVNKHEVAVCIACALVLLLMY